MRGRVKFIRSKKNKSSVNKIKNCPEMDKMSKKKRPQLDKGGIVMEDCLFCKIIRDVQQKEIFYQIQYINLKWLLN